ncbi:hypothetical protein PO909_010498 [Leuciscus waleckii]
MDLFWSGLDEEIAQMMPDDNTGWTLEGYIHLALSLSSSAFTVGLADEEPCKLTVPPEPESVHVPSVQPEKLLIMPTIKLVTGSVYYRPGLVSSVADSPLRSARVAIRAIVHESRPAETILPKSCFAETVLPEYLPAEPELHVSPAEPEPELHVSPAEPEPELHVSPAEPGPEPALHASPAEPALHAKSAETKAVCVMPASTKSSPLVPSSTEPSSPLVPSSTEPSSPLVPSSAQPSSPLVPSSTEPSPLVPSGSESSSPLVLASSESSSPLVLPSAQPSSPLVLPRLNLSPQLR